jgi:uracil-DNA glycosylase family 4
VENYVPGYGCSSAKLVIVGEAPGKYEVERGMPFSGPSGNILDQALACTPITRQDCYLTNVVKVRPPNNKIQDLHLIGHSIEEFLPQLWQELEQINPYCILALGGTALAALTGKKGIEKYRGSILLCSKTNQKLVSTLHPASLLHEDGGKLQPWKHLSWIKHDVIRAYEQSLFREYRPPDRLLRIATSSVDLIRFLERYQDKDRVTLDVETYKTFPQCIGLAFNSYEALSVPLFNDGDATDEIPPTDQVFIWKIIGEFLHDTKIKIMAQNAKFDEKRCRQIGLTWHDCWFSMDMGFHILYPEFPKKLQFISSVLTEEPYYKDEGIEFNKGKGKQANFKQWLLYNAKDSVVEFECCEKILLALEDRGLSSFFWDKIMPLYRLYSNIEDVGILQDQKVRSELSQRYQKLWDEKQELLISNIADGNPEIREVYKNFNVMSNGPKNQVAKLLFGFLKLPLRKDTGDDTLKSLANNVVKDKRRKDILLGILEVRKLRKTIGTYINAKPSADGRIHTQCNINGTETGRTSTGILQPPVSIEKEGIALQTMTKHEDAQISSAGGSDLRGMFIADWGFTLIEPDLSQAEDRVVCVLAKDWDALKAYERVVFKKNKYELKDDRHTITAMYVCSKGFDEITDYDRQIGKKTRHAGNYDMQKHMHMLNLAKFGGVYISEWAAGQQLEKFHAENPKIKGVFHAEIQQALQENDCILRSPFGRERQFFNRWGTEMFKEAYAYLPQTIVSDQVKFAMLRIAQRLGGHYMKNFFFLEESHDSFLALCRDDLVRWCNGIIKEELERPINFRNCTLSREYNLVIPCDIKVGKRWIEASESFPDGMIRYKETA